MSIAADSSTLHRNTDSGPDDDGHCCLSMSWEQREYLGRRGSVCSETRCARDLLGGVA